MSIKVVLSPRHIQVLHAVAVDRVRGQARTFTSDEFDALTHARDRLEGAMTKHRVPGKAP